MAATKEDIRRWLGEAEKRGATHLIVICDTYDWGDFPCYVMPDQDVLEIASQKNGANMQKVMEVYKIDMDHEEQLKQHRAFNY